ncbi:MAG: hypothetical protein ACREL7_03235 [Longimicrobiales bacterium]
MAHVRARAVRFETPVRDVIAQPVLRSGRDVWMLVRFNVNSPIVREVFADELVPFGQAKVVLRQFSRG